MPCSPGIGRSLRHRGDCIRSRCMEDGIGVPGRAFVLRFPAVRAELADGERGHRQHGTTDVPARLHHALHCASRSRPRASRSTQRRSARVRRPRKRIRRHWPRPRRRSGPAASMSAHEGWAYTDRRPRRLDRALAHLAQAETSARIGRLPMEPSRLRALHLAGTRTLREPVAGPGATASRCICPEIGANPPIRLRRPGRRASLPLP